MIVLHLFLKGLEANLPIHLLYIGGGHGGYVGLRASKLLSGLTWEFVDTISQLLQKKQITIAGGILHSCYSAMFLKFFRPFMAAKGVLLSYCAELSASSNWAMVMQWILDAGSSNFFSEEAKGEAYEESLLYATTGVISTKSTNTFMDLEHSDRGLPGYIDLSDESELQRELGLDVILAEKEIISDRKTKGEQFNDLIVMEEFNKHLQAAIEEWHPEERKPATPIANTDTPISSNSEEQRRKAEYALLLHIHNTLTVKITGLSDRRNSNKAVIAAAEQLSTTLMTTLNAYIQATSNSEQQEEQIASARKSFLNSCCKAINHARPLLEKELGWGDFLTNLLKNLINVLISTTNRMGNFWGSHSNLTLYTTVKAPLVADIEQVEKGFNELFAPQ